MDARAASIAQTAVRVVRRPEGFFREMPKKGGFLEPMVFMAAVGVLSGLLQALQGLFHLNAAGSAAAGLAAVVLIPILTVIFGFVGAAVLFVAWKLLGSSEDYETAFRCAAYLSALGPLTTLLGVIPYLGAAVSLALMTYYLIVASVEAHKIPEKKARTVFGAVGAVLILLSLGGQHAARKHGSEMARRARGLSGQSDEMRKQIEDMQKELEKISRQHKR